MSYYIDNNYLAHHGILGMKWGVRRYQNPDGSLTSAGESRYYSESGKRKFNFGEAATKVARVTHKVSSGVERVRDASKPLRGNTESFKKTERSSSSGSGNKPSREKMSSEKKKQIAKKVLISAGVVGVTAAAAYIGSKHIKAKALGIMEKEFARDNRRIMDLHKELVSNVRKSGYNNKAINDVLSNQVRSTNARLAGVNKYYGYQRKRLGGSTREAIRYLRVHR